LRVIAERMEFARGFVMTLTLPAKRFIDHAAMLFELAPIRSVVLTHSVNYTIDLAVCPNLSRLTSISFQSISATAQAIVAALTDPPSPRDVAVPIVDDRIGDTGFAEFLASPYLPSLAWLHVPSQNLSVAAVGSLALAPAAQNLRRLDLSHNRIGDEGVARICASTRLQNLEWLNLANAEIGVTLNEMLGFLLSRVRRRATETTVSTVRALADPSVLPKLRYLNLRGNRVNEADRRALRARFGANVHI
jgi:Leucine-rich repeat (LRR) protein